MKRTFLGLAVTLGLMLGSALPVTAAVELPVRIDCSDGDSFELTVDLDTLTALTSSIAAINANPVDLTCSLTRLSAPLLGVTFGNAAAAAQQSSGYVIGSGSVYVGCTNDTSKLFVGYFAVKMYYRDGGVRGTGSLKIPAGQCVAGGSLSSRLTCLAIVPTAIGGGRAWANSVVTQGSGAHFAPQVGNTIGWAFEDNGPNGGTLTKDRWKVNERPGSCPLYGDPNMDYYDLLSGDVTVRP
jgi:hypothetical protein